MLYLTCKLVTKKLGQEKRAILGGVRELFDILNNILKPLFLQLYMHLVSIQVYLTQQVHVLAFWAWIIRFFIWGT